jgi:predicted glutamine amidotransferase
MSAAPHRVHATFWLLQAPDSLLAQSHREPDGTGIGYFEADGTPRIDKRPLAAFADRSFAREAKELRSETFVAHIRAATTGALTVANTHPFEQQGRLFAHNGVIKDLPKLEARLGDHLSLVAGDTDSERFFALITLEIERHEGDVTAGIAAAARWVAQELPVFALNVILTTQHELWALRYPETHDLLVLERPAAATPLEHSSAARTIQVRSDELADAGAVVLATEAMDDDPGWRALASGELLHVDAQRQISSTVAVDHPPRLPLTLADLDAKSAAAQSQRPPG